MQEILLEIRYFERVLLKTLKKSTLFFLSNPVPFNGQNYQKQRGSGSSDQSLFRLRNQFRKITLVVMYYLTKFDAVFELFQKLHLLIYASQLMTYKLFHSCCPFEFEKCGKERKKLQKFEYLENEESFLDEIKTFFMVFEWLSFGEKIKFDKK